MTCSGLAVARQVGPREAAAFTSLPALGVDPAWAGPTLARAADGFCATATLGAFDGGSEYLAAAGFGFALPAAAVILGVTVEILCSASATLADDQVLIVRDGEVSANRASATPWAAALELRVHGGAADLWGLAWTAAQVNSEGFGVRLRVGKGLLDGPAVGAVDRVRVTVDYETCPPDSSEIDAALVATLLGDAALMALLPDGVYFDVARPGAQRFVLVSLVAEEDVGQFGGRAYEDALYLVKAVALGTSGADVKTAAARLDALLEDQPLAVTPGSPAGVPGYAWMTCHREARVRYTEVDDLDPSIRWQHRGGHYRVQFAVGDG